MTDVNSVYNFKNKQLLYFVLLSDAFPKAN